MRDSDIYQINTETVKFLLWCCYKGEVQSVVKTSWELILILGRNGQRGQEKFPWHLNWDLKITRRLPALGRGGEALQAVGTEHIQSPPSQESVYVHIVIERHSKWERLGIKEER